MVTFEEIRRASVKMRSSELAREVSYMVDCARVNADDTAVENGFDCESLEWHRVAMDSLEQTCAYAEPHQKKAVAWFIRHGVKF